MGKKLSASESIDALDAALAARVSTKKKNSIVKRKQRVNDAEPAHSIIALLGGVRELARCLGISPAAVTRWQTPQTKTDRHGGNGIIPEAQHAAILAVARDKRKRLARAAFEPTNQG